MYKSLCVLGLGVAVLVAMVLVSNLNDGRLDDPGQEACDQAAEFDYESIDESVHERFEEAGRIAQRSEYESLVIVGKAVAREDLGPYRAEMGTDDDDLVLQEEMIDVCRDLGWGG